MPYSIEIEYVIIVLMALTGLETELNWRVGWWFAAADTVDAIKLGQHTLWHY